MYYLGIDLGGTNIVAGVVDENYKIIAKESCKTNVPRPEEEICDDMALVAKKALAAAKLTNDDISFPSAKRINFIFSSISASFNSC